MFYEMSTGRASYHCFSANYTYYINLQIWNNSNNFTFKEWLTCISFAIFESILFAFCSYVLKWFPVDLETPCCTFQLPWKWNTSPVTNTKFLFFVVAFSTNIWFVEASVTYYSTIVKPRIRECTDSTSAVHVRSFIRRPAEVNSRVRKIFRVFFFLARGSCLYFENTTPVEGRFDKWMEKQVDLMSDFHSYSSGIGYFEMALQYFLSRAKTAVFYPILGIFVIKYLKNHRMCMQ